MPHSQPSSSTVPSKRTSSARSTSYSVTVRQYPPESSSRSNSQGPQNGSYINDTESNAPTNVSTKPRRRKDSKLLAACVHCKSLKVRCVFSPGGTRCQRCTAGNHHCLARDRKKRKPAPTHEDLQARSKQQDDELHAILRQFDQLKVDSKIEEWVRRATATRPLQRDGVIARPVPVLTCHYYSALIGPLHIDLSPCSPDYRRLPILLRTGILQPAETLDLFNLFFERINPFFSLLDGELHCPQKLIWLNHFLFTAICALASRHYMQRPGLYDVLMDIAHDAAGKALVEGSKSIETVQAFLLLAVYPLPKKKWADDRSWIFMGVAIRLARELQLDKPPTGLNEQDNLNRVRTWINCFCVDRSHATQFGKMAMVTLNDNLVRSTVQTWYKSPNSAPYDIGLCAYADLLLLMAEFRSTCCRKETRPDDAETPDMETIAVEHDKQLSDLYTYWNEQLGLDPNVTLCPVVRYRFHSFSLVGAYLRLAILSRGFQHCVKLGITRDSYILRQSLEAAEMALNTVIDKLFPSSLLGWAMEATFLYMSFCAAFLLNLLRPKFLPLLCPQRCATIVALVQKLIKILASEDVALDGKHSPAVYSKFLSSLFSKYYTPALERSIRSTSPDIVPQYQQERVQTPPHLYAWPDAPPLVDSPGSSGDLDAESQNSDSPAHVFQQVGEVEMDFSLQHFVRSTIGSPAVAACVSGVDTDMQYMCHYSLSQDPQ